MLAAMKTSRWAGVAVAVAALQGCASVDGGARWTPLFDGRSLEGWRAVGDASWRVAAGALVADSGVGYLATLREYADFVVRAEFYAESDTNSGVFVRCTDPRQFTPFTCYEVNIWDDRPGPEYASGAIVEVAKVEGAHKVAGRWSTVEVTARGDRLVVVLNGVKTVDVRNARSARGTIGLQYAPGVKKDHGLPIRFRKVEIREL
jgi:hypothetical protein